MLKLELKFKKALREVTAVDFDSFGSPCLRLRKTGESVQVVGADILAPVDVSGQAENGFDFELPRHLAANYAAIAVATNGSVLKLIAHPGETDADFESKLREHMGLEDGDYRMGYSVVAQASERNEKIVLTAALPEASARAAVQLFATGTPAPFSLELSEAAAVAAFVCGPLKQWKNETVGFLQAGAESSAVFFFNKGCLLVVRKFEFGFYDILEKLEKGMNVDRATAAQILVDGAFDTSQYVHEATETFAKQLVISRHFVERKGNCRIHKLFAAGTTVLCKNWLDEIAGALGFGVEFWDPFSTETLAAADGAFSEAADKARSRFAGALGAGLGAMGCL